MPLEIIQTIAAVFGALATGVIAYYSARIHSELSPRVDALEKAMANNKAQVRGYEIPKSPPDETPR